MNSYALWVAPTSSGIRNLSLLIEINHNLQGAAIEYNVPV